MVVDPVFVLMVPLDSVLMVPFLRFGVIWSKFNLSKPWSLSSFKFHFVSWLYAPLSLYCSQLLPLPLSALFLNIKKAYRCSLSKGTLSLQFHDSC